ncbi:hypothetical protein SB14R_10510 [Pseudomonas oryzihabitans]|nr:hypothetical protein SB14R_10510 [Pseudomonas psychrotolerans]
MANNSFTFTISAVDKATATVRKVNAAVDRLTAPFTRTATAFKGLGRELGFQKIGNDLKAIGHEAGSAARSIGAIVAPMAAITGLGTVAGIAALADNWAKLGRNIDNSARNIGVSTGQLQSFQGAAKLVGISTETTTSSLEALGTTMQDAQWGRNQGALLMLNKLGIGLKKTKTGANDVVGEYKAIADAIAKQANPQVQALIANSLGLGAMLPFLREGSKGITEYEAQVERLGFVMDQQAIERSKGFARSLAGLDMALEGTKNTIGNELIPIFKPLVDQFTHWLAKNRELIATDVAGWAKGFATWVNNIDWKAVGQGLTDFIAGIKKTVDWLGGWENAAIAVAVVMNASLIVSVLSLGGHLLKAGAGILSFVGLLTQWKTAATAAATAQGTLGAATAASGGLGLASKLGMVGLAGAAGYGVGTLINGHLIEGTAAGDWIGEKTAKTLAFFGNSDAKDAVMTNDLAKGVVPGGKEAAARATQFFVAKGWSPEQAAGISANLGLESNYNPHAIGDMGRAYGIGQWHYERQQAFQKWAGKNMRQSTLDEQLAFVDYEMRQGSEQAAGRRLSGARTAREAGEIVSRYYERPADADGDARRRGQLAEALLAPSGPASIAKAAPAPGTVANRQPPQPVVMLAPQKQPPAVVAPEAPTATPLGSPAQAQPAPLGPQSAPRAVQQQAPAGPYSQGAGKVENSKIQLEIEMKNAPEGTKAKVKSAEGPAQVSSRVGYSGVGALV